MSVDQFATKGYRYDDEASDDDDFHG